MPVHRCPQCSIPYVDAEIEQGACPGCNAPLAPTPGRDVPTPAQAAVPAPGRAGPFLLGLLVGCLIGPAALWAALRLGAPFRAPGSSKRRRFTTWCPRKHGPTTGRESEAGRQAVESAHAEAVKALDAANRQADALQKQKDDAEKRLKDALGRLAQEQGRRASLEKAIAEEKKPRTAPTLSFVRDWQLLGPFASTGEQAHDAVYPPERGPVQLDRAYDGFAEVQGGPAPAGRELGASLAPSPSYSIPRIRRRCPLRFWCREPCAPPDGSIGPGSVFRPTRW